MKFAPKSSVGIPFKPLHPRISMHILSTVLYTFSEVQIRRICLSIRSLFNYNVLFRVILSGKLDACSSLGFRRLHTEKKLTKRRLALDF